MSLPNWIEATLQNEITNLKSQAADLYKHIAIHNETILNTDHSIIMPKVSKMEADLEELKAKL